MIGKSLWKSVQNVANIVYVRGEIRTP